MEVFYAALASLGFGVFFNLRGRKLFAAAAGGGIGWLFYTCRRTGPNDAEFYCKPIHHRLC